MNDRDCRRFAERLDALLAGELPVEEDQRLRQHAGGCTDCAALLKVVEHARGPTEAELRSAVPAATVTGLWPRIAGEISHGESPARAVPPRTRRGSWLVPALAAVLALLVITGAGMFAELRRSAVRERTLTGQIATLERALATPAMTTDSPPGAWFEPATATVSVATLETFLRRLPERATLLEPGELARLRRAVATVPLATPPRSVTIADGLQAGEALVWLRALELAPERRVPLERLRDYRRRLGALRRS